MAQGVVARCYDLQDAAGEGCGKSYRLSGLLFLTGFNLLPLTYIWLTDSSSEQREHV